MIKYVIALLVSSLLALNAQAGVLLDQRAGPCNEDWVEGKHYVMESITTFNPLDPGQGEGEWGVNDEGVPTYEYKTLDRRFCMLDAGDDPKYIHGAWIAWSDGTNKGWLFPANMRYSAHNDVRFITMDEFYKEWVWKDI